MRTALTNISLDGVMQAPGRADEDTRDGFPYGGWAAPYQAMQHAGAAFANISGLLLGRRTYQDFYAVWPARGDSPYTAFLNNIPKYVVSRTLTEPLPWSNSVLLPSCEAVGDLSGDVLVLGSGELIHELTRQNLIDRYIVLIHPLILGEGRRLFPNLHRTLRLSESSQIDSGVVMATYVPAP